MLPLAKAPFKSQRGLFKSRFVVEHCLSPVDTQGFSLAERRMQQAIKTLRLDVRLLPRERRQQQRVCDCESGSGDERKYSEVSAVDGNKSESHGRERHSDEESESRESDGLGAQNEGEDGPDDESEEEHNADEEDETFSLCGNSNGCQDMARMIEPPVLMILGSGNLITCTEDEYRVR